MIGTLILESMLQVVHACVLGLTIIDLREPEITDDAIVLGDIVIACFCSFVGVQCLYLLIQVVGLIVSFSKFIRKTFCLEPQRSSRQKLAQFSLQHSRIDLSEMNQPSTIIRPRALRKAKITSSRQQAAIPMRPESEISISTLNQSVMYENDTRSQIQMADNSIELQLSPFSHQKKQLK